MAGIHQLGSYRQPDERLPRQTSMPAPAVRTVEEEKRYRLHRRFDRLGRLYGDDGVRALLNLRVAVFGLGGVGSFAVESLARSAVGHLGLYDFDDVCVTNFNRQLQALKGTVGQPKAKLLAERVAKINPDVEVVWEKVFYREERSERLLASPFGGATPTWDFVVDAVDNLSAKAHLLATCRERGIPVVSSMGAAGKLDPTRIRVADLADTQVCPLARDLRKLLRKRHGLPSSGPMGIPVVYSDEKRSWPRELAYDGGKGFKCICPHKSDEHGCDSRNLIDGTASFVTGAFGLACASVVVNRITDALREQSPAAISRLGTSPNAHVDMSTSDSVSAG